MLSECCDAPIEGEVMGEGEDAVAICSKCGDWMGCYDEDADHSGDDTKPELLTRGTN